MGEVQTCKRAWFDAVATFTFDLDVGQKVENVFPEDELTAKELSRIAYISLPVRWIVARW